MKLKTIYIVLLGLWGNTLMAQQKEANHTSHATDTIAKKDEKPSMAAMLKSAVCKKGLISIYQSGNRYYFEIPDSILKKDLLVTSWLVQTPGGSPKFGGEMMNTQPICFEKGLGGKMMLRLVSTAFKADSNNAIYKAVVNSDVNPIAMVFEIKGEGQGGKSSIIDATDFLEKENMLTRLSTEVTKGLQISSVMADKSFVKRVASYPINVELRMVRTYRASGKMAPPRPGAPAMMPVEAARIADAVTMEISVSILLMPERPMTPRRFDPRVGYFADNYIPFSDTQQDPESDTYVVRYRMEPKPEDMAKYKRGELVEPKNPIVYYIDPATPKKWRPYLIQGINDWNEAFKAAGFKNAIIGKEWPENDTTMSLEDARYKVLRYFPSTTANAYGPNIHDPRSGEVLQSYVGWYHNVMTLLHDWYMVQASPSDPRARKMVFSDTLMGNLIRFVSSHEVGHTLGLRHNMGSSSLTPVAKLRDKKWVEAHGHTNSIMDYARFNYVAQPEDSVGPAGLMPRINDYDKWAIKWGYSYTGIENEDADSKIVSKWVVDSLKANPRLWFGGEGMNPDSRSQSEDIGDDAMEAGEYGIKNLKFVTAHLLEWTKEDNDLYKNLSEMYLQVVTQFQRYALHDAKNIGSVYETYITPDQPGNVYSSEPPEKQKEAVAFLNKNVFETPEWLLDQNLLNKLSNPVRLGSVATIQRNVMTQLTSDRIFTRLNMMEQRYGKSKAYPMNEYLNDLKSGVWSELKSHKAIDIYRRAVQKEYISGLFRAIGEAEKGENAMAMLMGVPEEQAPVTISSDIGSVLALHLMNLRRDILAAVPMITDKDSKEHLLFVAGKIKDGLDERFDKSSKQPKK